MRRVEKGDIQRLQRNTASRDESLALCAPTTGEGIRGADGSSAFGPAADVISARTCRVVVPRGSRSHQNELHASYSNDDRIRGIPTRECRTGDRINRGGSVCNIVSPMEVDEGKNISGAGNASAVNKRVRQTMSTHQTCGPSVFACPGCSRSTMCAVWEGVLIPGNHGQEGTWGEGEAWSKQYRERRKSSNVNVDETNNKMIFGASYTSLGVVVEVYIWRRHSFPPLPLYSSEITSANDRTESSNIHRSTTDSEYDDDVSRYDERARAQASSTCAVGDGPCANPVNIKIPGEVEGVGAQNDVDMKRVEDGVRISESRGIMRCTSVLESLFPGVSAAEAATKCAEDPRLRLRSVRICRECAIDIAKASGQISGPCNITASNRVASQFDYGGCWAHRRSTVHSMGVGGNSACSKSWVDRFGGVLATLKGIAAVDPCLERLESRPERDYYLETRRALVECSSRPKYHAESAQL